MTPPLSQEQADGSRLYVHPKTGEAVPSVTTVINQLNKPKLTNWAARVAAEYAIRGWAALAELSPYERKEAIRYAHERERQESADLGTAVHHAIDCWAKGIPHEHAKEVDPYMNSFTKFLMEKRPRFLYSEVTLWNRTHNYAGTADAICEISGETWVADYKSGKSLYPEVGLQLSALAHGEFIITAEGEELEVPLIQGLAAIHVRPRSWKFAKVQHDRKNFEAFLACRRLYDWSAETAEEVLAA